MWTVGAILCWSVTKRGLFGDLNLDIKLIDFHGGPHGDTSQGSGISLRIRLTGGIWLIIISLFQTVQLEF